MSSKKFSLFKDEKKKKSFINKGIFLLLIFTIIITCSSIVFNWGIIKDQSQINSFSYTVSPVGFTMVSPFGNVQKPYYSLIFELENYQPLSYPFLLTGIIIFPLWIITLCYAIWNIYKLFNKREQSIFSYNAGILAIITLSSFLLVFYIGFPFFMQGLNIIDSLSLSIGFYLMFISTILFFIGHKISKNYLKN